MKYRINKGFIMQKLGNKSVIFDGEKSVLYTFNQTASFIFNHLKQGMDEEKIVEKMIKIYDLKKDRAAADIKKLIAEMKVKKIISLK